MKKELWVVAGSRAVSGALLFLSIGCGSSALVVADAACAAPDTATAQDADGADVPSHADAGADRAADAWPAWNALPIADGGADASSPFLASMVVHFEDGLLVDLDRAAGSNSLGDRLIGDKLRVSAGYVGDYVYLDHTGRVVRPWDAAKMGPDMVLVVSGYSHVGVPDMPPDPSYASARALFDVLQNGPRTGDAVVGVRESPEGRIHCEVGVGTPDEASCYLTGVTDVNAL